MSRSREQLVARALNRLGVIGSGQIPEAEDAKVVDDVIEPILSDLATRDIWQWGDPDVIDDDAFEHLAKLLANAVARNFGAQEDEQQRLLVEARLRELKPVFLSGQPQQTEYF